MSEEEKKELVLPIGIVRLLNRWWTDEGRRLRKKISAVALHIENEQLVIRAVPIE